jgi:hypothetical protein
VSILADAGYDFLLFDTQHSPWEIKQLQPSIQALRGKQAAPLVRVAANQAYQICFALDAGARGIAMYRPRRCRVFQLSDRPYNPTPDRNSRVFPVRGEFLAPSLALRFSGVTVPPQHQGSSAPDVISDTTGKDTTRGMPTTV